MPSDFDLFMKKRYEEPVPEPGDFDAFMKNRPKAAPATPDTAPSAGDRFLSGVGEAISGLNPFNIGREYLGRKEQIGKASKALSAGVASRGRQRTPEELATIEKGMEANLYNLGGSAPSVVVSGTEPLISAGVKARQGDVAGAAGTLTGAVAIPFLAAKGVQKAARPVRSALGFSTPEQTYGRALSASKEWAKELSPEIVDELIKRGEAPRNLEALSKKAGVATDVYGRILGRKWDEAEAATTPYREVNIRPTGAATLPPDIPSPGPLPSPYPATVGVPPPLRGPRITTRGLAEEQMFPGTKIPGKPQTADPYPTIPGKLRERIGQPVVERGPTVAKPLTMQIQPILDQIENYKQSFAVNGVPLNEAAYNAAARIQRRIQDIVALEPKGVQPGEISLRSAHRAREILDDAVSAKEGFVLTEKSQPLMNAQRELTNSIRHELGKARPDIAAINDQYSFWKDVQRVADATIKRRQGQEHPLGMSLQQLGAGVVGGTLGGVLGGPTGATAGAVLAGPGAAIFTKFVRSPGFRMMSAVTRDRLARQLAGTPAEAIGAIGYMAQAIGEAPPLQAPEPLEQ